MMNNNESIIMTNMDTDNISRNDNQIHNRENYDRNDNKMLFISEDMDSNKLDSSSVSIFRYKFTEEFMIELYNFSKIHQYDDRKTFKDSWNTWVEENEDVIQSEINRLTNLEYKGDILDKMFKSARYYFRKKSVELKIVKPRRQYISIDRELLSSMDIHIRENMFCEDYQPKTAFINFCIENESAVKNTLRNILEQGIIDSKLIQDKIKKTYKNRYFIATTTTITSNEKKI